MGPGAGQGKGEGVQGFRLISNFNKREALHDKIIYIPHLCLGLLHSLDRVAP